MTKGQQHYYLSNFFSQRHVTQEPEFWILHNHLEAPIELSDVAASSPEESPRQMNFVELRLHCSASWESSLGLGKDFPAKPGSGSLFKYAEELTCLACHAELRSKKASRSGSSSFHSWAGLRAAEAELQAAEAGESCIFLLGLSVLGRGGSTCWAAALKLLGPGSEWMLGSSLQEACRPAGKSVHRAMS
ncbi:hypothetical protein Droror1_Dr00019936 [Drosera rotundifolia]